MPNDSFEAPWVVEAFEVIASATDMEAVVARLRDVLRVTHLVYHSSRLGTSPSIEPYIRLTYPALWVKRYLQMGYINVDPVLREGFRRMLPFDWGELTIATAKEAEMLSDALGHGVGPHGLSIPVRSKRGHRGLFSMSYSGSAQDWERFRVSSIRGLVEIAQRVHKRVTDEEFGSVQLHLTSRELECLMWTAEGKEAGDIAGILNISPHTIRDYLKSARYKLDCVTLAQAVSKAIQSGLLPRNGKY